MRSGPLPPRRPADLVTAGLSRDLRLGPRRFAITIDRAIGVRLRDGPTLLAAHHAPVTREPRPAVLTGAPWSCR
ncbi:MAG: hypothetical protein ACRDOK_12895 [Streptosporangiaceae bacterium]